ncbi:DUF6291 domain-containing protein [Segatella copri]|uniref:DUF6291 domain-containing protein n=1 Tax=Segatella copri TaxID=165179 RepID=UPI001C47A666|nr:DUF6291 domain-containing protein [Segatella copri]MBW0023579.1 hypothetical protein [Segatella copri]
MNDSFILYASDYQLIEGLTDEQLGQLTRALFIYARDGEVINLEPVVRMAFVFIKDKIDRNQAKYQKKCERNRENIRKRWNKSNTNDTKENERIPKNTNVYERIPNDTTRYLSDSDSDSESDSDSDSDVSNETDILEPSKEGILSASVKTEAPAGGKVSKSQKIDYAGIKEYWNRKHYETKSVMPPITLMTENRKVMVKARLRQCKGDVKTLYRAIDIAMASDFMNGNNKKGWVSKFDWIFGNEQNFAKVLEGNFNNTEPAASQQPQSAEARAQDPTATERLSIGERYELAKHRQPASQQDQGNKFRWIIQQNLADLKKNPRNKPAKDSLARFYEKGVLQRLGIDWKPEK